MGPQSSELAVLFANEKGDALSDKHLQPVVDNAIENGLSPGGCMAKLLKDHRCHASLQGLEVEAISLAICPTFGQSLLGEVPWLQQGHG